MLKLRLLLFLIPGTFLLPSARAQIFAGFNAGSFVGTTLQGGIYYHPKNEDWLTLTVGGGYTLKSAFIFDKRNECIKNFSHGGWNVQGGARVGLTTDHHGDYPFVGANVVYSRQKEAGVLNSCDSTLPLLAVKNDFSIISGQTVFGYSWNPFKGKSIFDKLQLDFGLMIGFPLWKNGTFMSSRNYISGLGLGNLPIKSINLELLIAARYELWHDRYGYKAFKKVKR